jgi:hypothetical protein
MRCIFFLLLIIISLNSFAFYKRIDKVEKITIQHSFFLNKLFFASLTTTGIGIPPNFVNGRLHPGFDIGFLRYNENQIKKINFDYALSLGFYSIRYLQHVSYFKPSLGLALGSYSKYYFRSSFNVAVMLVQQLNDEFKYIGNGLYEKVPKSRMQLAPSLGLEGGLPILKSLKKDIGLKLKYEFGFQLPFSLLSSVLPLNQFHIGINVKPKFKLK